LFLDLNLNLGGFCGGLKHVQHARPNRGRTKGAPTWSPDNVK